MRWNTLNKLVLFKESLFGLPWVVTSIALAVPQSLYRIDGILFWILCAFISARVAGMAFNRLIDRDIDAQNPRTRQRVLPNGEATPFQVAVLGLVSIGLFVVSCGMINPLCLWLSPIPLALLLLYSYTKRFTPLCHFVLGAIHCLSPIFAWIAVCNGISPAPVFLGAAVMMSIAGSDVVYAMLDVEFDKSHRLHSIPMLLGTKRALRVAKGLHALTVALLLIVGLIVHAHALYFAGVVAVGGMYVLCYSELKPDVPDRLYAFLSTCNRRVALTLMFFTLGAGLWQRWS